jgi:hypothetical protein
VTATAEKLSGAGLRVAGPVAVLPGRVRNGDRPGSGMVPPDARGRPREGSPAAARSADRRLRPPGPVLRSSPCTQLFSIVICQVRKDSHV